MLGSFSKASALTPSVVSTAQAKVKSYREWKSDQISAAETKLKQAQVSLALKNSTNRRASASDVKNHSSTEAGLVGSTQELQNQIDKQSYQLSLAKDLSIVDYFVGYLTKQKDVSLSIQEVSGRLTADEVAELMTAYVNSFSMQSQNQPAMAAPVLRSGAVHQTQN